MKNKNRLACSLVKEKEERLAKSVGYSFSLDERVWVLDKNVTLNVGKTADMLTEPTRSGFVSTVAHYASTLSSSHTQNVVKRFQHMLVTTGVSEVSDTALINYRASLDEHHEWYLGVIRGFIRQWYRLELPGIDKHIIRMLDNWSTKGNRKGDAVKRMDPKMGPLSDLELQAFNEGSVQAYERGIITIAELAMCLCVSNTGRRPVQISHLRIGDLFSGKNTKGEPYYIVNIPRAKHFAGFRQSFRAFALTEDLWVILSRQAINAIRLLERRLGFTLQDEDKKQVPLFTDLDVAWKIKTPRDFREIQATDKLHIAAAEVTDTLQYTSAAVDIRSERTGQPLHITSYRLRYTIGTRAAREGFGVSVIAELLDHETEQNASHYIKNIPEHVKRIDEAVGFHLMPYAQAFAGLLVDAEHDAKRGDNPSSRIRVENGEGIGTCGEHGPCGANVPIPCYTCIHFQPWLNGPHEELYHHLISERERIATVTGDMQTASTLDRTIVAVAEVVQRCKARSQEINKGVINNG